MTLLAYHNDPAVKLKYQSRYEKHRRLDQVVQGEGFSPKSNRGCFTGCTLDNYDHNRFPIELGWPLWLARLADRIFEGLLPSDAPQFGSDLHASIGVGVDLEKALHPFLIDTLEHLPKISGATRDVIDWLKRGAPESERQAVRAAAAAAIAIAASASAEAADAATAACAAYAADVASAHAADAATARPREFQRQAKALLETLRSLQP